MREHNVSILAAAEVSKRGRAENVIVETRLVIRKCGHIYPQISARGVGWRLRRT